LTATSSGNFSIERTSSEAVFYLKLFDCPNFNISYAISTTSKKIYPVDGLTLIDITENNVQNISVILDEANEVADHEFYLHAWLDDAPLITAVSNLIQI